MKLGKQLAYSRSISPSICVFYWRDQAGNMNPLEISGTKLVGQKEGFTEAYSGKGEIKAAATHKALAMGNPHTIEYCNAPPTAVSIGCHFSVRVESNVMSPYRVDDLEAKTELEQFTKTYQQKGGFRYLAKRYVMNICNGCWLWRNQNTLSTTIHITTSNGLSITVTNAQQRRFTNDWHDLDSAIDDLANEISEAFGHPQKYCFIEVKAELKVAFAQEIHPSQAFIEKSDNTKPSKVYQSTNVDGKRTAIIGGFKVGAAIQQIDDWYPDADKALRVGSYGVDKAIISVYRHPSTGLDLYSQLKEIELLTAAIEATALTGEGLPDNAHFVAACMIKGGLFQQGADQ